MKIKDKDELKVKAERLVETDLEAMDMDKLDIEKLIHDLKVHQEELKIQNEELRIAQEELEKSRDKYSELYDFAPVGYITFDYHGVIKELNLWAAKLLGKERTQLINKPFMIALTSDSKKIFFNQLKKVHEDLDTTFCEIKIIRKDKTILYCQLRMTLWKGEGEDKLFLAAITDISDRRKTEKKFLWQSEVNKVLAELSQKLIASASFEEISVMVLEHAKCLTESIYGFVGYIDSETGNLVCPTFSREIFKGCQMEDEQVIFEEFTGLWGWVLNNKKALISNSPVHNPFSTGVPEGHIPIQKFISAPALIDDKLVGQIALANSSRDYTDQDLEVVERLASIYSIAIRQNEMIEDLRDSEQRYKAVVDNIGVGVMLVDPEMRIISVNKQIEKWFPGIDAENNNDYCYHFLNKPPLGKVCHGCPTAGTFKSGMTHKGVITIQNEDEDRSLSVISSPLRDKNGEIIAVIELIDDITDRIRAENELKRHRHHLEEMVRERTEELREANEKLEKEVAERKQSEAALRRRDIILQSISFAAEQFLKTQFWQDEIDEVLLKLSEATKANIVYIFQLTNEEEIKEESRSNAEGKGIDIIYQFLSEDTKQCNEYEKHKLHRELEFSAEWLKKLKSGKVVYAKSEEICSSDVTFICKNLKSIIVVPIFVGKRFWGGIGFETCMEAVEWSTPEAEALKTAAETLGAAIQHREAEEKIRKSEARYRAVVEDQTELICRYLRDGRITFVNEAYCRYFGIEKKEIVGKKFWRFVDIGNLEEFRRYLETLIEVKKVDILEERYIPPESDARWIQWTIRPLFDDDGEFVEFQSVGRDITEQKKVVEALRESEEKFRKLAETASSMIAIIKDDRFVYINPIAEKISGYDMDKLRSMSALNFIHPDFRDGARQRNLEKFQGKNPRSRAEVKIVAKNGEERWMDISSTLIEYQGEPAIMAVAFDITEKKQAQAALEEERALLAQRIEERTADLSAAYAELERAARLKDEFLASMSHELRTPLSAVLGKAETLEEQIYGELNPKQLRAVKIIQESGSHLLSLINDILDVSKIEAGKLELQIQNISIKRICESSLRMIKQIAQKKNIKIYHDIESEYQSVHGDERRLKQILVNLLSNAVKFTPENGKIGLDVSVDEQNNLVTFTVWDTGIGISEKDMSNLFKPFVQLDSRLSRMHEGTGLGLSLVYRLAEMHGGSVGVESELGKGSSFTVAIPWRSHQKEGPEREDQYFVKTETPSEDEEYTPEEYTIFLVDDNENNILTLSDYLKAMGYRITLARNGLEAVEMAKEKAFDLIIMDIQMPKMNGLEAIKHIRDIDRYQETPIIALTALTMPGDKEKVLNAGADEYHSKPVRLKNLANELKRYLA